VPFAGFGTLISLFLLFVSFLFLFLGIIGEYVGLIYEEVKMRPNFLVSELLDSKPKN
jgi:dolichol-phosphate mannosyltransferase